MLENQNEIRKITSSLIRYFNCQGNQEIADILKSSHFSSEEIAYDNWNGGTSIYALIYEIEIDLFLQSRTLIDSYCNDIREAAQLFIRNSYNEQLGDVRILPIYRHYLSWSSLSDKATKKDVLEKIEQLKKFMISVSTGGPKIQTVDSRYHDDYNTLSEWLTKLGVENPNPYKGLWDWYGRWSQGDLSTYASRRTFISNMYQPLVDMIIESNEEIAISDFEPTGWDRVDRTIYEMKKRLLTATTEEQFQAIGMLGRETMITIAQQVFNKDLHDTEDGVEPSNADAKRMLDAFINYEIPGSSNERTRKFAKSSIDLANNLTHNRMATKRDASMCLISVTAVASLINTIHDYSKDICT